MSEPKVLIKIGSGGFPEVVAGTHQMQVYFIHEDDLEGASRRQNIDDALEGVMKDGRTPPEVTRKNFDKFIEEYIKDNI